ncbi:MAG: radical SAM protein, partial [Candidatus Latescibacteria bacterium]|nr:radical SAM protein [Candidatus Latescibacterota bacterium]
MSLVKPKEPVRMVYARPDGSILDHPSLLLAGVGGGHARPVRDDEIVPLPRGSDLFLLPGRRPIGLDPTRGTAIEWDQDDATAVAAFLAPAWTMFLHPAYRTLADAPALPLFAYSAVGFADGQFWATGVRVDEDVRQDPWRFDLKRLAKQVEKRLAQSPENLVVQQLERCALHYGCRAAQNFFIGRHEAPIPTSVACNSKCIGCISLQPDGEFRASHDRIRRSPRPEEIADLAVAHIERVPDGVVSFGQGCEGEPLLGRDLLPETVRQIRARTSRGTVNVNTNGSLPEVVEAMCRAGLDAIRVSMNSARDDVYAAYYRPKKYTFDDVRETLRVMRRHDRFRSINYLVFPGVTDTDDELDAISSFIEDTDLDLIQMRNLNIDPELYRERLPAGTVHEG